MNEYAKLSESLSSDRFPHFSFLQAAGGAMNGT
jgi:hypothetical protein